LAYIKIAKFVFEDSMLQERYHKLAFYHGVY